MFFQRNIAFFVIIFGIFGMILIPVVGIDFAYTTSDEEGGDTSGGGDDGGGDNDGGGGDEPDPESEPEPEPQPQPSPDPGFVAEPVDPCEENPAAEGCAPETPIDPCIENPSPESCGLQPTPPGTPPGLVTPSRGPEPPDDDCLYDPSLPKCAPINGVCPEGFNMNEDGQCFPDQPCPPGYARADNDESGACLPINSPTPPPTANCHPSYPDTCIRGPPPPLNCDNISFRNFKVVEPDPHGFDGDNDGIGCEGGGGGGSSNNDDNSGGGSSSSSECKGQADCFRGTVTKIVDGDTLDVNNVRYASQ